VGTWDVGIWDNDDAAEWVDEISGSRGLNVLRQSLSPTEVNGYYLEAPEGVRVLCAADTLVAALKLGGSSVPEEVLNWVNTHASLDFQSLVPATLTNIRRVVAEHSELRELWEEHDELFPTWLARVEAFTKSLGS
jgi:hypothetical protein